MQGPRKAASSMCCSRPFKAPRLPLASRAQSHIPVSLSLSLPPAHFSANNTTVSGLFVDPGIEPRITLAAEFTGLRIIQERPSVGRPTTILHNYNPTVVALLSPRYLEGMCDLLCSSCKALLHCVVLSDRSNVTRARAAERRAVNATVVTTLTDALGLITPSN
ncbi:hypothetical protein J6590_026877 [Homalodisca vitripennis]|nr:hypothetical protein J6590_026877 [Homalodisca vitripennis]